MAGDIFAKGSFLFIFLTTREYRSEKMDLEKTTLNGFEETFANKMLI
jgi:hypothetical protein